VKRIEEGRKEGGGNRRRGEEQKKSSNCGDLKGSKMGGNLRAL